MRPGPFSMFAMHVNPIRGIGYFALPPLQVEVLRVKNTVHIPKTSTKCRLSAPLPSAPCPLQHPTVTPIISYTTLQIHLHPHAHSHHEFFTTPTFAARITLPFNVNPLLCVWNTSPSAFPSTFVKNVASSRRGSNLRPAPSIGSKRASPCFSRVDIRIDSDILRPACRLCRSRIGFVGVEGGCEDGDGFDGVGDGGVEEEEDDSGSRARDSWGTDSSARSRLSIESSRSVANRWMANCRADSTSRFVRSWRLRKSATERRYLS